MVYVPGNTYETKLRAGNVMCRTVIKATDEGRLEFQFPFNRVLMAEIKAMQGAKWHGFDKTPRKIWSVDNSFRNQFQLSFMMNEDPYAWFSRPMEDPPITRKEVMAHQKVLIATGYTYRVQVWAAEMGTGKTLAAIELCEIMKEKWKLKDDLLGGIWYAGPRSGVKAVGLEVIKWKAKFRFRAQTYDGWVKTTKEWQKGCPAPRIFIIDESSKIKNAQTQRSKAVLHICEAMRAEHGRECLIILMTGTPAPKSPVDFWHQCEVAQPGFLREGDGLKFKARLCLTEQRESIQGGMYPHMITWLDDDKKCAVCGQYPEHMLHTQRDEAPLDISTLKQGFVFGTAGAETAPARAENVKDSASTTYHDYKSSVNEVAKLYRRMQGLVTVMFKKDCIDLPEKRYEIVHCPPTVEMLHAARLIKATSSRAITALTLLRELSDGFQYEEIPTGRKAQCPRCAGTGRCLVNIPIEQVSPFAPNTDPGSFKQEKEDCPNCNATGQADVIERVAKDIGTPKDEAFTDILDGLEDVGRCIAWGGFTGTVDRIKDIVLREGWAALQIDGRGYNAFSPIGESLDPNELLIAMDARHPRFKELRNKHDKICVCGNPEAGGMALTLTASPVEVYFSNSFNGEARMQSEDRFHRIGADDNRGCTIIDLICLKPDQIVLDNLKLKKRLQALSLTEIDV